jgi:flagellar biosynthesis anti-sigma factor FlgM
MKIDGQRPSETSRADAAQQAQQAQQVERARTERQEKARSSDGDRLEVSGDARLMGAALQEASRTPAIRQDVVERARQKLAAGQVGNDPERLADRMIDSLLGQ